MNYYNENDAKAAAWLKELINQKLIPNGTVDTRSITDISPADLHGFTQCHFFAGVGGWSLALQLAGWPVDRPVWTGSCPCQPFSVAGKGKGISDERHLWPVFRELIRERRPTTVFGEQVASKAGREWLSGVFLDLEGMAYRRAGSDLCAAGVGAPHIRQRLYWVADSNRGRCEQCDANELAVSEPDQGGIVGGLANTESGGFREHGSAPRNAGHINQRIAPCGMGITNGAGRQPGEFTATRSRHGDSVESAGSDGEWMLVSFAADCLGGDDDEPGDGCSICGLSYSDDCQCPGPTHDGYEYRQIDGSLYARRMGDAIQQGLEGYYRDGDHRNQPGRERADTTRPVATPGSASHWFDFDIITCLDGKARRVESGTFPLAHGIPGRVGLLRGYGNAIVPQVAAEFIKAFLEV